MAAAPLSPASAAALRRMEDVFNIPSLSLHEEFVAKLRANRQGFVPVAEVAAAAGVEAGGAEAARHLLAASTFLVLDDDGTSCRRRHPPERVTIPETQRHTGAAGC
jgi:hypothetical protein